MRTIYPTDGAFRGVTVPEGTSRVEFRYEPRAFPIGVVLAVLGLVGFFVIGLVRWSACAEPTSATADLGWMSIDQEHVGGRLV